MHGLGHEQVGDSAGLGRVIQQINVVAHNLRVQRCAEFLPVGEQFVQGPRLEHRTGEDVRTDFGTFFNHADADFLARFGGFLLQSAGGGQAGWAGADDDDVEFHKLAFHRLSPTQGSLILFDDQARSLGDAGALYLHPPGWPIQTFV
ncbi:hypothetical protein FQZ97_1009170 [compost metagenome]